MIEFELSYPPSVNQYKNIGRMITTSSGKVVQTRKNSPETNRYYYEAWIAIMALRKEKGLSLPFKNKVSVEVDVYPPDAKRRDL